MNTEQKQITNQLGPHMAPLGVLISALQLGQHIIVEYPIDKMPSFKLAINHYRKYLKKGFYFEEKEPGVYDVWLQTETNEPISNLSPLGKMLKHLQFGQRIVVEYPIEKTPPFPVAMAHQRKYQGKGFLYTETAPGIYEVWLGTRKEATEAHRGLRHVQTCFSEDEILKIKNNPAIERDWVTVVLIALRCGIASSTGRRLQWKHVCLDKKEILVTMRNAKYPVRRAIPTDLLEHLQRIRPAQCGDDTPLCPFLFGMENKKYQYGWVSLRNVIGAPASRTLSALTWPWKRMNPRLRDHEIAMNHITALEKKWLSGGELEIASKIEMLSSNAAM